MASQDIVRHSILPDAIQLTALEKEIPHTHYIPFLSLSRYSISGPDKQGVGKLSLVLKTESTPLLFTSNLTACLSLFKQIQEAWSEWNRQRLSQN